MTKTSSAKLCGATQKRKELSQIREEVEDLLDYLISSKLVRKTRLNRELVTRKLRSVR
jgi:hypothetical protein